MLKIIFLGKILAGIELNTKVLNVPIEILGYNIDYKLMDSLLPSVYISSEEKNKIEFSRLYEKCLTAGMHINKDELTKYNPKDFASKFIHSLIIKDEYNKKFIDDEAWQNSSIFYRKYMSNPSNLLYVEMDDLVPDFKTASDLIRKCGGLIFIPHIFEYRENSDKILDYILNHYDIDGIECYYTTFTDEQHQRLLKLCADKNLLISGGSDYHGLAKPKVKMGIGFGNLHIPSDLSIIKNGNIDFLC